MSIKNERIESIIKKNVTEIIQFELKDPHLGFCTITEVEVTNDYSYAKIYVSFLGKDERKVAGLRTLNRAKGYIRSLLSKKISIRKVPELNFVIDKSFEKAQHIEDLIKQTKN